MALVAGDKFFARVRDRATDHGAHPHGLLKCGECSTPLQEALTGSRRLGDGSSVCSDCYFKLTSKLEKYPILTPRIRRG